MKPADWYITPEEYNIASKNGIKKDTLEHRIRYLGWDKKRAITEPLRQNRLSKWVKFAAKNGISRNTFNSRIYKHNWSLEDAATIPVRKRYPKWIREELKKNSIKYKTFIKRMQNGWNLERAYSEKTWKKEDSIKKALKVQKKMNVGLYKSMNDFWKLKRGIKNAKT